MSVNIYTEPCERIWRGYKLYSETYAVQRSGFHLTGMNLSIREQLPSLEGRDLTAGDIFRLRGESVLEHQGKVAWLTAAFASNFRSYFGDTSAPEAAKRLAFCLAVVGLCHDVGETVAGDIPDDGNPLHGSKDPEELRVFHEMTAAFDRTDATVLSLVFQSFQKKDKFYGMGLYALDKAEAVLTNLVMESHGVIGHVNHKSGITDLDRYLVEQAGSDKVADTWGLHTFLQIRDFPMAIVQPVMTLLDTAVYDVRGEGFSWRDKEIQPWQPEV